MMIKKLIAGCKKHKTKIIYTTLIVSLFFNYFLIKTLVSYPSEITDSRELRDSLNNIIYAKSDTINFNKEKMKDLIKDTKSLKSDIKTLLKSNSKSYYEDQNDILYGDIDSNVNVIDELKSKYRFYKK